jgi:D-alanyl-D-alanine carboxypeptidase (penicillin-binding protein 5/6)
MKKKGSNHLGKSLFKQSEDFFTFLKSLRKKRILGLTLLLFFLLLVFVFSQASQEEVARHRLTYKIRSGYLSPSELTKIPLNQTGVEAPGLTAHSALVIDYDSGTILYQKNAQATHLPASTTKIMTALVALESYDLSQVLTVPDLDYEGQVIKLQPGEQLTLENLLYALLVASANDAAETLAANYPGGRAAFIAAMNQKAQNLSLSNTHFVNPTGFDELGQYTTPFDLIKLAKELLAQPLLAQIVATQKAEVYNLDRTIVHPISNINQLLGQVAGLKGVKTGWTTNAGECLTTYVERDGERIMTAVLGSEDRFGETKALINWVYNNFAWRVPNL